MILLENDNIQVTIAIKGAELRSVKSKITDLEYLWDGDPKFWPKYSPVLFPVIGAMKDSKYIFENKEYELPRHGFARDHDFVVERISDGEVLFTLSNSAGTFSVYPFEFTLGLRYQITGSTVSCTYEVSNPGQKDLLFSVGGHPAFAVPLTPDTVYEDYYLDFTQDEALIYHKIEDDSISDETITLPLDNGKLTLKHDLFYQDALVFKNLKSDAILLRNTKNQHGLHFRFSNFPFFGIWAAKDADFVCLEPWCGIADSVNHNQQLTEKEGIISLSPGLDWKNTWEVEVF